jgi:hypothetical protein
MMWGNLETIPGGHDMSVRPSSEYFILYCHVSVSCCHDNVHNGKTQNFSGLQEHMLISW